MKKILTSLAVLVILAVMAAPVMAQESLPFTTDLLVGRDGVDIGDLTVNNGTISYVIDTSSSGWRLEETHLYVGDVPPGKSSPGRFPYAHKGLGGVASDAFVIILEGVDADNDGIVYIAAHAALVMQTGVDEITGEPIFAYETAWAQGDQPIGKGANWATYFSVRIGPTG